MGAVCLNSSHIATIVATVPNDGYTTNLMDPVVRLIHGIPGPYSVQELELINLWLASISRDENAGIIMFG